MIMQLSYILIHELNDKVKKVLDALYFNRNGAFGFLETFALATKLTSDADFELLLKIIQNEESLRGIAFWVP